MTASAKAVFPEPHVFTAGAGEPILRWGVLAPGRIASAFVRAAHTHTLQRVVAVGSRTEERAETFARAHGIDRPYGSYAQVVDDDAVDVVYVAAPASEHVALGLLAIAAGKHVVIEKPLATTASEGRRLVEAASARGVFLMEAMWSRYLPQASVVRRLVDEGELGEVHTVFADFSMRANPDPSHRLYRPELGGGALLDVGVYPLQLSSMVVGGPTAITAVGSLARTGVDASSTSILRHAGGQRSTIVASIAERSPSRAYIAGSAGRIELDGPFHIPTRLWLGRNEIAAPPERWEDPTGVMGLDGLCWEATAAATYIGERRSESPLHTHRETVEILRTIDEIRRQITVVSTTVN